jgi:multidrug efflux pump subunit AcrA (membrane-fusion protein)
MGAKVDFLEPEQPRTAGAATPARTSIRVPSTALKSDGGASYVWLVRDGKLTKRPVTPGPVSGGFLEIRSGLSGGEQLLVGGVDTPTEGMKVKTQTQ